MWMRTQLQIKVAYNYNKRAVVLHSQSPLAASHATPTEYQLADMFTKALPEDRFKYLVRRIGMRCLNPAELEVVRLGINPMIQQEPEDLPKDNPKLEIAVLRLVRIKKKMLLDKGSKERSPPHNLRQKPGQYICCQNHKLIADIENDIMDPVHKLLSRVLRNIIVIFARTFRVILFSIHNDEWKSFQFIIKQHRVTMSSATSDVTYTSVYTDSEPGRAFWGTDDKESVAPPSPDFIPGPENPQTPPIPQDEREPMFIQAHDPDYVPEPIYPEYIPLEDDHEFLAEEQPLPPVDLPITESPGYVTESDPEEDPEEYEDDETEDDPEDEEDEEEEEHLAPADSTTVIPADETVFPPEETEPVIPPPSTDITIGARISVRPQIYISLPPKAEIERLLTMTTPSPSPPIALSPPSAGERLARISSTQALIDAVTTTLPPPSLPPLPPYLSIPSPVDRRDDIPESEQPSHKRFHLSTLGSRYEVGESSTTRPTRGRGIDYGFVSTIDAEERRQGIRDAGLRIRKLGSMTGYTGLVMLYYEDAQESRRQCGWWKKEEKEAYALARLETYLQAHRHSYSAEYPFRPAPGTRDSLTDAGRLILVTASSSRGELDTVPEASDSRSPGASGDATSH
ncbi:hypothetical protein Tco_0795733 [Tanacetum coccineum]